MNQLAGFFIDDDFINRAISDAEAETDHSISRKSFLTEAEEQLFRNVVDPERVEETHLVQEYLRLKSAVQDL